MDKATVPVKSAFSSKVNWTQAVGGVAMFLTFLTGGKFNLSADDQLAIVTVIGLVQSGVTWVLRTWFTTSILPSSL